jgi:hypothetical protein
MFKSAILLNLNQLQSKTMIDLSKILKPAQLSEIERKRMEKMIREAQAKKQEKLTIKANPLYSVTPLGGG